MLKGREMVGENAYADDGIKNMVATDVCFGGS